MNGHGLDIQDGSFTLPGRSENNKENFLLLIQPLFVRIEIGSKGKLKLKLDKVDIGKFKSSSSFQKTLFPTMFISTI